MSEGMIVCMFGCLHLFECVFEKLSLQVVTCVIKLNVQLTHQCVSVYVHLLGCESGVDNN